MKKDAASLVDVEQSLTDAGVLNFAENKISANRARAWIKCNDDTLIRYYTRFLPASAEYMERLYCILNDIWQLPRCVVCTKTHTRFDGSVKGYKKHCSMACTTKDPDVRDKKNKTMVKRYGVKHALQSPELRDKCKQTNMDRFGTEYASSSAQVKDRVKQTNMKRFGTPCSLQYDAVARKSDSTMMDKYGVKHALQNKDLLLKKEHTCLIKYGEKQYPQTDEFKQKFKQAMVDRFGVDHPSKSTELRNKAKQSMMERYGVEYTLQSPELMDAYITTMMDVWGTSNPQRIHLVGDVLDNLNNPDWLFDQHYTQRKSILQISKELQITRETLSRWFSTHNITIQQRGYSVSSEEQELIDFITTNYTGTVITNNRSVIHPHELDIILPDINVAFEYCGLYWHSDVHNHITHNYHKTKMDACTDVGLTLYTIFSDEWCITKDIVKSKVLHLIGCSKVQRTYARLCGVVSVDTQTKRSFFNKNHIQRSGPGSITYGLTYNDEIISVMTFIKKSDNVFVLNRFASSRSVVGGFSKLLKHFKKHNTWSVIETFADLRWSRGNLYTSTGFTLCRLLKPDYYYVVGNKRIHKFNYRRKMLPTKLSVFNPELSEVENCKLNGVYRIWDCGKIKYITKNEEL